MCPPGVDQTTRSCQVWHIMAPTVREKCKTWFPAQRIAPCDRDMQNDNWVWEKLTRPEYGPRGQPPSLPGYISRSSSVTQLSKLLTLPRELLDEILAYLNKPSLLAFALSCSSMLYQASQMIRTQIWKGSGTWAGQPIACLGTWLTTLPPQFEANDMAARSVGFEDRRPNTYRRRPFARDFNWTAISLFKGSSDFPQYGPDHELIDDMETNMHERQRWMCALEDVVSLSRSKSKTNSDRVQLILVRYLRDIIHDGQSDDQVADSICTSPTGLKRKRDEGEFAASTGIWYLRNLDRKEFIRITRRDAYLSRIQQKDHNSLSDESESAMASSTQSETSKAPFQIPRIVYVADYTGKSRPTIVEAQKKQKTGSNGVSSMPLPLGSSSALAAAAAAASSSSSSSSSSPPTSSSPTYILLTARDLMKQELSDPHNLLIEHIMAIRMWWPDITDYLGSECHTIKKMRETTWAGHRFDVVSHRQWMNEDQVNDNNNNNNQAHADGSEEIQDERGSEQNKIVRNGTCTRASAAAAAAAAAAEKAATEKINGKNQWKDVTNETVEWIMKMNQKNVIR